VADDAEAEEPSIDKVCPGWNVMTPTSQNGPLELVILYVCDDWLGAFR
jgi:hypothetical protein